VERLEFVEDGGQWKLGEKRGEDTDLHRDRLQGTGCRLQAVPQVGTREPWSRGKWDAWIHFG
jgi:hypothetical protein